ncbi:hypothetical protein SCHPADRAFT_32178 [Schizopora paradoxa]|uniref:Uncharacterized protein n=1 Tax=Schizopora paradoxa TaxID=27342 RepID=A0A0H2SEJ6_9AGAM|nr:hypothetical protein SCHPADRAFT_32178 [Schizopora paradoxa]
MLGITRTRIRLCQTCQQFAKSGPPCERTPWSFERRRYMSVEFFWTFRFAKISERIVDDGDGASIILPLGSPSSLGDFMTLLACLRPCSTGSSDRKNFIRYSPPWTPRKSHSLHTVGNLLQKRSLLRYFSRALQLFSSAPIVTLLLQISSFTIIATCREIG